MSALAPGLHLVHKPVGPSSHAVVEDLREPGSPKLCHGGALDPFASGLLLVLAGDATRMFPFLHGVPKLYDTEIVWGTETDNDDPGGDVVAEGDPTNLTPAILTAALAKYVGWHDQVPPVTSNKRVEGERAYVRVQRGETVVLPPCQVYLHSATWLRHDLPRRSFLRLEVAGGFYVRSLARDLGRDLGCRAHLGALNRRSIGPWSDPGPGRGTRTQGEGLLPWCASRKVTTEERDLILSEGSVPRGTLKPAPWPLPDGFPAPPVRLMYEGRMIAIAPDADPLVPDAVFRKGL